MLRIDPNIAVADRSVWDDVARPTPARPDTSAEIRDLWRILSVRRAWVIGTAAILSAIALVYVALAPPLYSATAQILIDPRDKQIVTNDVNSVALSPDGGVIQVESQARVIESDSVLTRAVIAAGLLDDPEFGGRGTGLLSWTLRTVQGGSDGGAAGDAEARAIRALRRKLAVKRADKVFVIDVIVTAGTAEKAARIVNAIAGAYLQDQSAARSEGANRASADLRSRLDDLRRQVNDAENQVEKFKADNDLISAGGRLIGEQQLAESNIRIVAARARTAEAQTRLQQIKDARGTAFGSDATPEAIQSPVIERLRGQFAELASKQADLGTQLGARHPFMESVRMQMQDVRRLIESELNRIAKSAETDYQRALANERALNGSLSTLKRDTIVTGQASVRLRELERQVDTNRAIYASYLSRTREIQEQAGIDTTNARVIGWARPPQDPSWPLRIPLLVGGLLSGLGLGASLAFVREYLDPTILSRRQLERVSNLPVVAEMPPARPGAEGPANLAARLALDRLHNQAQGPSRSLSVLVTSSRTDARQRRGAIRRLAAVAATRDDQVLVVDGDLDGTGTPSGSRGLVDVLRGEATLADTMQRDHDTGVCSLGVGDPRRATRDALGPEGVDAFLSEAGRHFDLVLIDAGTLAGNPRVMTLATAADRLLVVVRDGATRQRDLLDILDVATLQGGKALGTLLVARAA